MGGVGREGEVVAARKPGCLGSSPGFRDRQHGPIEYRSHGAIAMPKRVITGTTAPPSSLPFSQLVEANGFVFLAGQVGNAPGGSAAVPGGIEPETPRG